MLQLTPEEDAQLKRELAPYSAPQNEYLAHVAQLPQDQAIKVLRLSHQANISLEEAAKNPNAVIQDIIGAKDFEDVGKLAPKTYSFLSNPLHMAIARDKRSVTALTSIEDSWVSWNDIKEGSKSVLRSAAGFSKGVIDFGVELRNNADATYAANHTPEEVEARKTEFGRQAMGNAAKAASDFLDTVANKHLAPDAPKQYANKAQEYTHAVLQQAPQIAAQIAIALATGGTSAMAFMGSQIAGSQYLKLSGEGVEPARAFGAAIVDAAAQAPLERIGLNKILKKLPAGSPRKLKAREVVESGLTEGVTEWIQQYPEALSEIWAKNPDFTPEQVGQQFMRDFAEITKEGAYQGLVAAPFGFLGGAVKISLQKKTVEANLAQHEKIQAIVANTPVLRDNPEFAEKYLEELTDGAKTYIDADALLTLYQSDILPKEEISELLGVTEDQVEEAAASGQMVEVSRAKYDVASVQHKEIHQALKDDIAQGEDGVTMRQVVERKENAKNLQDIRQAQAEVKKQRDEVKAESDKIFEQMKAAGVRDDVAKSALVALVKNAYVMSDNPAQWLRDKGPIFQRGAASPEGALHQFAGPSAKTADHLGLSQAKQMEKDGADNEAIRKATGWHKGMEGKWRFEIDDSQAALIDQGQLQATSKEIETLYKQANKAKDPAVKEELLAKADEMAANYDEATKPRLRNILSHPTLYKAYPWIGDVKVIQSKLPEGENGGYDPATNTIQLSKDLSPDKMKETLLHEVQHVIQEQEDFARGGSPDGVSEEAFNQYQRLAGEVEARDAASRAGLTDEQRKETAPDLRSDAIVVHGGKEIAYNPEKGYNIGNKDGSEYEVEGSPYAAILRETGEYEGSVVIRDAEGNAYGPDARSSAVRTPGNRSGKTIGLAVTPELVEHGVISLVGRTVRSPKELATISHVLRHPGYEKFHVVYVSGDKVVHHETISAGLPDRANIMEAGQTQGQFFQRIDNNLSIFGADGYYLIHNHPSGDPRPSGADVSLTKHIANITTAGGNVNNPVNRGFKGHVVLDHTTYTFIGRDGGHYQSDIDTTQIPDESYDATSLPHWSLDTSITSPTAVAGLAAGMNLDPNNSVVFYLTTKHKVRGVQVVPNALLADEKKAVRYLRMQARQHYSARFVIVTDNDQTYNASRELVKNYEHVLDVYHASSKRFGMQEVSKNANPDEWMGILDKGGGTRLLEDIGSLYQNNDDKRGSIHWNEEGRAIITLFQNADPSTVIHEMVGHYFVQNLIDQGALEDAPAWMKKDRKAALAYAGVEDWEAATKEQRIQAHEKLARAAEAYMMEGKAPSIETRSMFKRFKEWLTRIYDTVSGLGVELNPELRGVFDRMLATEEEISQVELLENYHQRLPKEILDTLSESQKTQLDKAISAAREKAKNILREKVMRFISADNQFEMDEERKKTMEFIREEVAREPLYIARAAMSAPANMKEVQAAIDARIEELNNEQVEILVHNAKLGVEKKGAIIDDEGYMTGEWFGGFSNNQKWYKDMLELLPGRRLPKAWGEYIDWVRAGKPVEEGKRPRRMPPKMREMFRDIAVGHLERGWYEETFGEIPENQEFLALRQSSPSWEIIYNYGGGLKLNEEQTRAMYPDKVEQLPQNMLTKNGGFTADLLADIFDFSSGDELLYRITTNPTFGQEVQRRLKLHMQQFQDLIVDPAAMRQEAQEAMYNDDGLTLLAIEDQLIKEKLGQILNAEQMRQAVAFRREEAKRSAEKAMANLSIEKAIKLHTYIAAERRAAEKVAKALAKGDMETAQEQKAVQMFNHAMVMKSLEARRQFEKTTKYLKRQQKSDKTTWKKEEHFVQAAEILRRFGFLRKDYEPLMREETLSDWAKRMNETMDSVAIADWILLEKFEGDPKKLTLEQLRDVENAVRNIKRLAQTENAFVKLFKQADIAEVVATSADKLADAKDIYVKEPEEDVNPQTSRNKSLREYRYSTDKMTTFLNRLDKWHDFGWFHNLIYRPVYESANQVSELLHMIKGKEDASLKELCPTKEAREAMDKRVYYPELGASVSKRYLLEMASHVGSESNRRVLFGKAPVGIEKSTLWVRNADGKVDAESMGMTQDRVMAFLAKNLTAAEWKWVQRGWDNINLLWPMAQEVHLRMTGFTMQKVEALPFETKTADGQTIALQGGYYPLKEDYRANSRAAKREEEREGQPLYTEAFAMSVPKTFTGYTNERTGATYSIDLRQSNRYRHIQAVAHDIAFRETITDLRRLVNNNEFKDLLEAKTGQEGYRMIREFVAVAANPKIEPGTIGQNLMDKWANILRERTIIAALMLNMKTALQNFANPFLYGNAVDGFGHIDALNGFINRGAFRYWTQEKTYKEDRNFVLSKSAFMRDRVDAPDYTLNEFHNDENFWMKWGGKLLAETDNLTAVPVWLEAYHKKVGEGANESDAVFYADTLIDRAIGSGRKIDTASIMRGNATTRLITMFGTFMNTQFNSWKREFGIALRDRDAIRLLTTAAARWLLFSIAGLLLSFDLPDPGDDKWLKKWASEILAYPVRLFPVVGNIAAVALNRSIGAPTFGVRLSPIESQVDAAVNLIGAPISYIQGKKTGADMAESIMSAAAFAVPFPDQFNHWFWNAYDLLFNDMEPEAGDLLKRRPRKER